MGSISRLKAKRKSCPYIPPFAPGQRWMRCICHSILPESEVSLPSSCRHDCLNKYSPSSGMVGFMALFLMKRRATSYYNYLAIMGLLLHSWPSIRCLEPWMSSFEVDERMCPCDWSARQAEAPVCPYFSLLFLGVPLFVPTRATYTAMLVLSVR